MTGLYEPPKVTDYGDLVALTAAVDFAGNEDGGQKVHLPGGGVPHHT